MSGIEAVVCIGAILIALLSGYLAGYAVGTRRRQLLPRVQVHLPGPRHRR